MAEGQDFSKPGFGWSNNVSKTSVTILNDQILHENLDFSDFPGQSPIDLLRSHTDLELDYSSITSTLKSTLIERLRSVGKHDDLDDFASTGLSNDRKLQWALMHIPPHIAFHLHAHPNIELIVVIKGRIHEYRMKVSTLTTVIMFCADYLLSKGSAFTKDFPNNTGPDLSNRRDLIFDYQSTGMANFLSGPLPEGTAVEGTIMNEVGSIHLTFTQEEVSTTVYNA